MTSDLRYPIDALKQAASFTLEERRAAIEGVRRLLEDARSTSLDLLQGLPAHWVRLFPSLDEPDWKRSYVHPENGPRSVEQAVILYDWDWHGRHRTAHVTQLSARMGW